MANGLTKIRSDHHYATGMILLTVGVVGAVGSVTGTLAAALAALWAPNALYSTDTGAPAGSTPDPTNSPGTNFDAGQNAASNAVKAVPVVGPPLAWLADKL